MNGEWKDVGNFIDVKFWGDRGQRLVDWLSKGAPIAVSGQLKMESWDDKNTGDRRTKMVCMARDIELLETKAQREQREGRSSSSTSSSSGGGWDPNAGSQDDDLPF